MAFQDVEDYVFAKVYFIIFELQYKLGKEKVVIYRCFYQGLEFKVFFYSLRLPHKP